MYRAVMFFLALTFTPAMVLAQQPCTTDARQVVNEMYRHMLERQADASSSHWVQQLESGQMNVREVVRAIAKSPEHTQRFHQTENGEATPYERSVARLYRHILSRQPDGAGLRAHAELAQRDGPGAVVDRIIDSNEYNQQFGDWGVPGSGGIRYCAPNNRAATQTQAPARQATVTPEQRRFRVMDRNNDGVINRNEWRGSQQSFNVHDWNRDGVLSGEEVDEASARAGRTVEDEQYDREDRFENMDVNNNNRIEPREWHGTVAAFNRLDVNNDNFLSRAEVTNAMNMGQGQGQGRGQAQGQGQGNPNYRFGDQGAVATSGQMIRVYGTERWTDTGVNVRAGDTLVFDAQGTVRLSSNGDDVAGVGGARSGRRAQDAPLNTQTAGALIGRIGNSDTFIVGNRRSLRAPATGRLYLGVNDDHLLDNEGEFQVTVTNQGGL